MRVVVDTGVFSAALSRRRRVRLEAYVALMTGNQIFLAAVTVSELRYGALVAGWGEPRRTRLEESIQAATVVPVSDKLLTAAAGLRFACRVAGHALHDRRHANDLWVAASAIHIGASLLTADSLFEDVPGLHLHQ
ncbi:MAG TPA: PIN domain-containing protein [Acidimicrobiales bacterium]|nr:PIN domain-containing protein [Acidimicrobiales bacterium]